MAEDWKLQVSDKIGPYGEVMVNIRANSPEELAELTKGLAERAGVIVTDLTAARVAGQLLPQNARPGAEVKSAPATAPAASATAAPTGAPATPTAPATGTQTDRFDNVWTFDAPAAPQCKAHGKPAALVVRKKRAGGTYKTWSCADTFGKRKDPECPDAFAN